MEAMPKRLEILEEVVKKKIFYLED